MYLAYHAWLRLRTKRGGSALPSPSPGPGVKALGDSPDLSDDHFILAKGNLHDNGQAHCVISASHCATPIHMLIFYRALPAPTRETELYVRVMHLTPRFLLRPYPSPLMGVAALRPNLFSTLSIPTSTPFLAVSSVPLSSSLLSSLFLSSRLLSVFLVHTGKKVLRVLRV